MSNDPRTRRRWITRRLVGGLAAATSLGASAGAYALGIETNSLRVTHHRVTTRAPWPAGLTLRIAALADIHACEPWMSAARIADIVARTNTLGADVIVLLGDYVAGQNVVTRYVDASEWAPVLGGLRAPLGVHAILGNHDWREDRSAQKRGGGPTIAGAALHRAGIRVLENEAVPLRVRGHEIWLAGLGDQLAFLHGRMRWGQSRIGIDDLAATLAPIPDGAPAILLAHEPDIFPSVPARVALTLSGHTHGGQVRLFGYAPVVPSRFGNRYAYGHIREHTDLVVSGGLGMSIAPIRFGVTPEIVLVDLSDAAST